MIETDPKYWDCECERDYIKPKSQKTCPQCRREREEQPDSRVDEVAAMLELKAKLSKFRSRLADFANASHALLLEWEKLSRKADAETINRIDKSYPFHKDFHELTGDIMGWKHDVDGISS